MSVEWQSKDFLADWTGLFIRKQLVDIPPTFARTARNVDFWGSAPSKRAGNQLVNGAATMVTSNWTNTGPGSTATGTVASAAGFQIGDFVFFLNVGTGVTLATGQIGNIVGSTITLTGALGSLPQNGVHAMIVRHDLGAVVTGMYHVIWRDGFEALLAASGFAIWNIWGTFIGGTTFQPTKIAENYPTTTISSNWASTTAGPLTSRETLVAVDGSTAYQPAGSSASSADIIRIVHAGTIIYEGTVATIALAPTNQITLTAAAASNPQGGDTVIFFPHRVPGPAVQFCQFNNRVYVFSSSAANTVLSGNGQQTAQRQPPTVIEENAGVLSIRRMGVRPPTFAAASSLAGAGVLNGNYNWRFTYLNGQNGQESEGSPQGNTVTFTNNSALVQVTKSPDPQVTGINIYRTLAGQDGTWYLVTTTPLANVNATFTDNVADTALGQLLKTFVNEPPPDTMTYGTVWVSAGALIGIDSGSIAEGGENVAFSDAPDVVNGVYKLESWPINNTLFVNRDDGDKLKCAGSFFDSVVVWKGRSTHRILGTPPSIVLQPLSVRDDQTGVGILSSKGFVIDNDVGLFASEDGVYQISRYDGVQQGFVSERISRPIDLEWLQRMSGNSASPAARASLHMVYDRLFRRVQIFAATGGFLLPAEDFVYQLEGTVDGTPHGWSEWSIPTDYTGGGSLGLLCSASCAVRNQNNSLDNIYMAISANGLIVQQNVGAGDWGVVPVFFDYATTWFAPSGGGHVSRGRAVDCAINTDAGTPAIALQMSVDFGAAQTYSLPLAFTGMNLLRPLVLLEGEYHSVEFTELSVTGLFSIQDFTYWYQRLPVGVTPRVVVAAYP